MRSYVHGDAKYARGLEFERIINRMTSYMKELGLEFNRKKRREWF